MYQVLDKNTINLEILPHLPASIVITSVVFLYPTTSHSLPYCLTFLKVQDF